MSKHIPEERVRDTIDALRRINQGDVLHIPTVEAILRDFLSAAVECPECARLREALEPFAEMGRVQEMHTPGDKHYPDNHSVLFTSHNDQRAELFMRDLRRARAALKQEEGG